MVEVEKGSEETGWLRARNLTKEPRADGVTKVGGVGFPACARARRSLAPSSLAEPPRIVSRNVDGRTCRPTLW